MKTLLSWLIANIEVFTTVVLVLVFEVYVFTAGAAAVAADDQWMLAVGGAMGIVAGKTVIGGVPTKNTVGDIVNLCVIVVVYILVWTVTSDDGEFHAFYAPSVSVLCVSLVVAAAVAAFTLRNFDEVVSRRMLYANSNASLFGIAAMYTFNRFVAAFSSVTTFGLVVALMRIAL